MRYFFEGDECMPDGTPALLSYRPLTNQELEWAELEFQSVQYGLDHTDAFQKLMESKANTEGQPMSPHPN